MEAYTSLPMRKIKDTLTQNHPVLVKKRLIWVGAIFLIILLTGCATPSLVCEDPDGCIAIRPNDPIQIAYLLPITGEAAVLGVDIAQGIEVGFSSVNEELLGHPLALRGFDSGCQVEAGERAARLLSNEPDFVAVIGPACTDVATAVTPIISEVNGVMISPAATAVDLNTLNDDLPTLFRTVPENRVQAVVAARFAREDLGAETAVTLHDGSNYAVNLSQTFTDTFIQQGGTILGQVNIHSEDVPLSDQLTALIAQNPSLIYMPLTSVDANNMLNRFIELNLSEDTAKIGTDLLLFPQFPILSGSATEGLYLTGPANNGDDYALLLNRWQSLYETLPETPYHAFAFDAFALLAEAIEATAVVDNRGSMLIGRRALRQTLTDLVNVPGVTGMLTCSPNGDCSAEEAIGVYILSENQVEGSRWPPLLVR